jgi:phage tail-like protein
VASTLPIQINTPQFAFLTGQYYTIYPVDNTSTIDIGRIVFTECTGLEMSREKRKHYESGSSDPSIGGDKREYGDITLRRGYAYNPETNEAYAELENWFESGQKVDLFIDIFDDQEGVGNARDPIITYYVKNALPVKCKPWEGKANDVAVTVQELVLACEKYNRVTE